MKNTGVKMDLVNDILHKPFAPWFGAFRCAALRRR
jgi:hypothetical protein